MSSGLVCIVGTRSFSSGKVRDFIDMVAGRGQVDVHHRPPNTRRRGGLRGSVMGIYGPVMMTEDANIRNPVQVVANGGDDIGN